jgi:leader peptidase (prepilin peptidase)/N-methyltransferase
LLWLAGSIGIIGFRGKDLKFALPFGTFLAPAAYVAVVWGEALIAAYLSRFPR